MNHRAPLVAAFVALASSMGAATLYLATNDWFGAGDLTAMLAWSLPLSGIVFAAFRPLSRRFAFRSAVSRYAVLVPLGGLLGYLWTVAAALVLGGWIMAFSFPVLFCWAAGGLLAGIVAAWLPARRTWPAAGLLAAAVMIGLLRLNAYAQAPAPQFRVVMAASSTDADVDRFWTHAIGLPGPRPTEHSLRAGVRGAGVTGHEGGRPVFTVTLDKGMAPQEVDALVAHIGCASGVARVEPLQPGEHGAIRTSVSY